MAAVAMPPAPSVTALSLLSMDPSPAVVASAQTAADSRHGLINLTRLVRSLDARRGEASWVEVQKTWETVLYARALLGALRDGNEQASTTTAALADLERILSRVEVTVQDGARRTAAPAPTVALPLLDMPAVAPAAAPALLDEAVPAKLELGDTDEASLPPDLASPPPKPQSPVVTARVPPAPPSPLAEKAPTAPALAPSPASTLFSTDTYFAKRRREDDAGGEEGLLPLKTQRTAKSHDPMDEAGMRQRLMGSNKGPVIGTSQLHEELGGQLADMSRQLKRNALHFSSSLEEEKTLLDSSTGLLEKNLETTKTSKGQLSKVSRKGRGTTCMTIGIIIVVVLLFVWTMMLIRFT